MITGQVVEALIAARLRLGLTQHDVAARMGVTNGAVSMFERRRHMHTKLGTVERYARALGYRMDWRLVLDGPVKEDG